MDNFDFSKMMEHGFLIIPKALLEQQIRNNHCQEGEVEAFLRILMKVNFSETTYNDHQNSNLTCKRGESLYSYRDWSHILHWSTGRTYRFIRQLSEKGMITFILHPSNSLHIKVTDYDKWVGNSEQLKEHKKNINELFHLFWGKFHEVTQLPKTNIAKAQKVWKKLSPNEQQLAIDRIEDYYYQLSDVRFTLQACNYLSNKAFLNEY